jgi:hypothetical protein
LKEIFRKKRKILENFFKNDNLFKFYENKSFYRLFFGFTLSLIRILSFLGKVKESLFGQTEMCMREIGKMIISKKKIKF